jgi:hypothetical protein
LAFLLHNADVEVAVDFQLNQEMANISSFRVEGPGWDASDAFVVDKAILDWSRGDQKEITPRSAVHKDAAVFVACCNN